MEFWFATYGKYHFFVESFEVVIEATTYFEAIAKLVTDLDGYSDSETHYI